MFGLDSDDILALSHVYKLLFKGKELVLFAFQVKNVVMTVNVTHCERVSTSFSHFRLQLVGLHMQILVLSVLRMCAHNEFLSCLIEYYDNEI